MSNATSASHRLFATVGLGKELDYLVENLSMLVSAGMPVSSALDAIAEETQSHRMKRAILSMRTDIESGLTLWAALERSGLFREHVVSLVRIGEESGRLVENLKVVSVEEEKDRLFRSKLRSAMTYPIFVLLVTAVVGIGIAWFILPKLALVFSQLKIALPWITKALISVGVFLNASGWKVLPAGSIVIAVLFYFAFFFPKTKVIGQYFLLFIPGVKQLISEVEMARFGFLLGTLLSAGIPVVKSLDSLVRATDSVPYRKLFLYLRNSIEAGNSFQKSFALLRRGDRRISRPIQQLIVAAERSGNLPETFLKIGSTYEGKADATTKNLTVILEPILLVLVWLGVVGVALAVILPIYSLVGGLNQNEDSTASMQSTTEQPLSVNSSPESPESGSLAEPQAIPETGAALSGETPNVLPVIRVQETNVGYLNVRDIPAASGALVGKVVPGDTLSYTEERDGWFSVVLPNGESGWVSGDYVERVTEQSP
ncbi:MAG: type II secretion system F family protein [Candidatus Moraniibacteriota bacterium]|nr:MAG: type II secretion system F family protein [Candidatus Moranbacteria bacterium]